MTEGRPIPPGWREVKDVVRDGEGNIVRTVSRFLPPEEPGELPVVARIGRHHVVRRLPNGDELLVDERQRPASEPGRPYAPQARKGYRTGG